MELTDLDLKVCTKCFRLTGHVTEKFNGLVPVFCICELMERKHGAEGPSIIGGIIPHNKVHLMWTPTSDHKNEKGEFWHTPYFAGFGWGGGKKEHIKLLENWIKDFKEYKT